MKEVLAIFWPHVRKHAVLGILTTLLICLAIFLRGLIPVVLKELVDVFMTAKPDILAAYAALGIIALVYLCSEVFWRVFDQCIVRFELGIMRELEQRSFKMLLRQSASFYENQFTGSLVKSLNRLRGSFEGIADAFFFHVCTDTVMVVMAFVLFLGTQPALAAMFGVWMALFVIINYRLAKWKFVRDTESAKADSMVSGALADSLGNHDTVQSYAMHRHEIARFKAVTDMRYEKNMRSWQAALLIAFVQSTMMGCFQVFLIWWLIRGWEHGTVGISDFVLFQTYVVWMFHHLWQLSTALRKVFQYFADAKEMADIFAIVPDVQDARGARPLVVREGAVAFHAVGFRYRRSLIEGAPPDPELDVLDTLATKGEEVIRSLSLVIPARQTLGLVGASGAGKTTIARLLQRAYDPDSGFISVDDQDLTSVTLESLRQQVIVVSQTPGLFHRQLGDNIRCGRPDATDEEVVEAAKKAHAWEFIQKMPLGLRTLVGERGVKLSGGQRQRIALARAILSEAPVIILDEPTSALDSETEALIQEGIDELLRTRTCIVIAHRLSTLEKADRIVVLQDGKIIQDGTDKELRRQDGVYADLWNRQSGGYIADE